AIFDSSSTMSTRMRSGEPLGVRVSVYSATGPERQLNAAFTPRSRRCVYRRVNRKEWRMKHLIIAAVAALAVADPPPNVTGTWQMGLQGGHVVPVALVLKQDGKVVTGTIALPT